MVYIVRKLYDTREEEYVEVDDYDEDSKHRPNYEETVTFKDYKGRLHEYELYSHPEEKIDGLKYSNMEKISEGRDTTPFPTYTRVGDEMTKDKDKIVHNLHTKYGNGCYYYFWVGGSEVPHENLFSKTWIKKKGVIE